MMPGSIRPRLASYVQDERQEFASMSDLAESMMIPVTHMVSNDLLSRAS